MSSMARYRENTDTDGMPLPLCSPNDTAREDDAIERPNPKPGTRASIACTECRSQHLRCDAALPTCSRCKTNDKSCTYKTMRGRRRLKTIPPTSPRRVMRDVHSEPQNLVPNWSPAVSNQPSVFADNSWHTMTFQDGDVLSNEFVQSYYANFHRGHPCVLPLPYLGRQIAQAPGQVSHLISVMRLIGSMYLPHTKSDTYRQEANAALSELIPQDGFAVQSLLLFAIALEWSNEADEAEKVLERAKDAALAIQLHRRSFAVQFGQGCAVLEESWRRTWWELYIVDALFAGLRHLPTFSLWSVAYDADLPSEEACYVLLGDNLSTTITSPIPPPRTLHEYDNRAFLDDDTAFSSFTYLIDAARILGTALATVDLSGEAIDNVVRNAEANLVSWDLHLPHSKRDTVSADGTVDEIIFQAHMVRNTVSTHLHRPRSRLHLSTMEIIFSKFAPPTYHMPPDELRHERHTVKALSSAKKSLELFILPAPPASHTPFVLCMGSLAAVTHISACENILTGKEHDEARDRIRVFIGVLKAFEPIWPQASRWLSEIKIMARTVFESNGLSGPQLVEPGFSTVPESGTVPSMEVLSTLPGGLEM